MSDFRRDLTAFIDEIESLCLEPPKMLRQPLAAVAVESGPKPEEWGLKEREAKGPYSIPPASTAAEAESEAEAEPKATPKKRGRKTRTRTPPAVPEPKVTRSGVSAKEDQAPSEREQKAKSKGHSALDNGKKVRKKLAVTEQFTQFEEGFDGIEAEEEGVEEQSQTTLDQDEGFFDEEGDECAAPKKRTRLTHSSALAVADNLKSAREEYTRTTTHDDPLLSALGSSSAAVVSQAITASKQTPMYPLTESPRPSTSSSSGRNIHSHKKKPSIIEGRKSAESVDFDETQSDADVSSPSTPGTKKKLAMINKQKFPDTIVRQPSPKAAPVAGWVPKKRVPWSMEEEDALVTGINRHGVGNWKKILDDPTLKLKFRDRTNVQLKDKHRNMVITGYSFESGDEA